MSFQEAAVEEETCYDRGNPDGRAGVELCVIDAVGMTGCLDVDLDCWA